MFERGRLTGGDRVHQHLVGVLLVFRMHPRHEIVVLRGRTQRVGKFENPEQLGRTADVHARQFDLPTPELRNALGGIEAFVVAQQILRNGVLAAPLGFVEDGSRYCLLARSSAAAGSVHELLLKWLLSVSEKA